MWCSMLIWAHRGKIKHHTCPQGAWKGRERSNQSLFQIIFNFSYGELNTRQEQILPHSVVGFCFCFFVFLFSLFEDGVVEGEGSLFGGHPVQGLSILIWTVSLGATWWGLSVLFLHFHFGGFWSTVLLEHFHANCSGCNPLVCGYSVGGIKPALGWKLVPWPEW